MACGGPSSPLKKAGLAYAAGVIGPGGAAALERLEMNRPVYVLRWQSGTSVRAPRDGDVVAHPEDEGLHQ